MRGMRHFLAALLTAALLLSLAACGSTNSAGQLRLYYPAELSTKSRSTGGGDAIASVQVDWQQIGGDQLGRQQQAQYIMEQLLGACKASGFTTPVPDGTALRSCTVTGGTVSVDLSSEYDHLTGIDRTIADYCITLSLLQLTGIYAVRITVMDVSPANHEEVYTSAQVLLIRIVSGLGTTAIAANSLGVSAESLCYMAGYGVQDASLAMVGQAVGAHRRDMAKRIAWLCTGMGMAIMALTGVGLYVFAPALMGIFTADAAVIALGAQVLRIEAFAEPMFGASIVASGAMQGAGDSTGCFVLNLVSMWGIRLTLAVLLAPRFGLVGVWFAMCAELCTRGALFLLRLARGKWLDKGALA